MNVGGIIPVFMRSALGNGHAGHRNLEMVGAIYTSIAIYVELLSVCGSIGSAGERRVSNVVRS